MPDNRSKILDAAEELLQESGFGNFSYQDIATDLGIKKAAIHYHFPAKADLGVALVRRYLERFNEFAHEHAARERSPRQGIEAYFGIAINYLRYGARVCPLGVLEAEFHAIPKAMQVEIRLLDEGTRDWLEGLLAAGLASGEFSFTGPARDKALLIVAAVQGALQIARAAGPKVLFNTLRQIKQELFVSP
jgi:AcrR family transcriptional regulator